MIIRPLVTNIKDELIGNTKFTNVQVSLHDKSKLSQDNILEFVKEEPHKSEIKEEFKEAIKQKIPKLKKKQNALNLGENIKQENDESALLGYYTCPDCGKEITSQKRLKDHMRLVHQPKDVQCDECDKSFKHKFALKQHKFTHGDPQFSCHICGKLFRDPPQLKDHHQFAHENKKFVCDICQNKFNSNKNLKTHKKSFHPEDVLEEVDRCSECGKQFISSLQLRMHERGHKTKYTCEECGVSYKSKSSMEGHIAQIHRGEKHSECNLCGKSFTRMTSLKRHTLIFHEKVLPKTKRVQCDECGKWLYDAGCLQRHMRQHGDPQFTCDICQKKFNEPDQLKDHHQVKHENKPIICDPCGKVFSSGKSLKIHKINYHTAVMLGEVHICTHCGKGFNSKNLHQKHEKKHSIKFTCKSCGLLCTSNTSLKFHFATVHRGGQIIRCDQCGKQFYNMRNLTLHNKLHTTRPKPINPRNLPNQIFAKNHEGEPNNFVMQSQQYNIDSHIEKFQQKNTNVNIDGFQEFDKNVEFDEWQLKNEDINIEEFQEKGKYMIIKE